ncbi:MAG: hypothetical protein HY646_16280 [Acidobacteria bacterium]|nr:hypothetical protein [Acidobacteriota bacterium]
MNLFALVVSLWLVWLYPPRVQQSLVFEVTTDMPPASGRLFIVLGRNQGEPRTTIGRTGMDAAPVLARDVSNFGRGNVATLDRSAAIFPIANLDALPAAEYFVQALFDTNIDLKSVNAPGNAYSDVHRVHIDPRRGGTIRLQLTKAAPPEQMPPDDQYVKYIKLQSQLLTKFHGRPIYLRAGVILPRGFDTDPAQRYPLRVHIGGYGSRFTGVQRLMAQGSEFRRMWLADDTPRMIYLHLDGDGPLGDPYQVNSANHGPYGDAITQELIPYVEKTYRGIGQPWARVTDGGSTGGWVSLALKVFYPDFFNAVWSSCPDGVDFRGFQLVNIYTDKNAYVNSRGFERPSARDENGEVRFTMRHECQMENVMGLGDSWTMSGGQWGAWNATYGPRGADGRPVPLWDPRTGEIDSKIAEYWKKYDFRLILEQNWKTLGPKMRGKLNIWVGEADNYFLNNAVHMLGEFLEKADPPAQARIVYGPGEGHCWTGITPAQMMKEMAEVIAQSRPRGGVWEEQASFTSSRLRGVSAASSTVAWASGNRGTFLKTVDGVNWEAGVVAGAEELDFRDVHAIDANTAYLLSIGDGDRSRIYKTNDGGRTWSLQFKNENPKAFFDGFAFWDANNGIAFSDPVDGRFLVIRTSDGGATWKETLRASMPPAIPGEAGFAASGTSIVVSGTNDVWIGSGGAAARVFRSTDRGTTWTVANTPIAAGESSAGIFSLYFRDAVSGYAVGGDYQKENEPSANFAVTIDGGRTWIGGPQLPGFRSVVHFIGGQEGFIVAAGPSGTDFMPVKGTAWKSLGSTGYDTASFLPRLMTGWIAGANGRLARWRPGVMPGNGF